MSAVAVSQPKNWWLDTDEEGNRDYTLVWGVETTAITDGPEVAMTASGLPVPGAYYAGDVWAFYNRKGSAKLVRVEALRKYWDVTTVFSTRPVRRCTTDGVEDPLLEPHRVRGSFAQVMAESLRDGLGNPIQNSSEQRYTGSIVQASTCRPTVELEMNVAWVDLAWLAAYADSVNDSTWWSQPARTIKCIVGPWERVLYGTCYYYFVVRFTFELNRNTWDVLLLDEGTRVKVAGSNPARYAQYKDEREENAKVLLDGTGNALAAGATPVWNRFRILTELDFSAVGWPASLL